MKINLNVRDGETTEQQQFNIEEPSIMQLTSATKIIKEILQEGKENEEINALLGDIFNEVTENKDEEAGDVGTMILKRVFGSLDVFLVELPDQVLRLISTLSGVDHDVIMNLKADELFDVYDAIIEVNDIEKIVKRAKKSFALTKSQKKVMNLFQNKETDQQTQQ